MRRALIAATAAALFGCNPVFAQVGGMASPTPGIGSTSPLGMTPGSSVPSVGLPMGATELASPGLSPMLTDTTGMMGTGTLCSAMASPSAGASGTSTNFDGGGLGMGTGTPLPGSAATFGTCSTGASGAASSSAAMSSSPTSSPSFISRTGIPLGAVQLGSGGLSATPVPSSSVPTMSPAPTVTMLVPSSPVSTMGALPSVPTLSPTITNVGPRGMSPLPGTQATTTTGQVQ
jgi:hypothetical protein